MFAPMLQFRACRHVVLFSGPLTHQMVDPHLANELLNPVLVKP